MSELISSKWVDEFGVYYPIDGNTQLHQTPGNGIFELFQSQGQDKRIGLKKIANKFEFNFKIYDLDCNDFLNLVKILGNLIYLLRIIKILELFLMAQKVLEKP